MRDEELARRLVVRRGADGRCTYDEGAKRELVEKCRRGDVSIAKMARAYGVNANQLHNWISLQGKRPGIYPTSTTSASPRDLTSAFIPVMAAASPERAPDLKLDITFDNGIQADLKGLRREDVLTILPLLAGLPCSDSTRR